MNGNIGLILKPNEKSPNVEIKMKSLSKKSNDDVKPEVTPTKNLYNLRLF